MNIKNKINSIQFKTMALLISFSILILLILWAFQIIFLTTYYEKYQVYKLTNIVNSLKDNTYSSYELESIAYKNDICLEYRYNDEIYLFNGLDKDCILYNKSKKVSNLIDKFQNSSSTKEITRVINPTNNSKSILYNLKLNDKETIILNTALEDVNSTTSALRNQLIYITLIVILIAIIVSFYISKFLNKHIIKITKEAKKMASGNHSLKFEKTNIEELDELTNALIYANEEINKTDELRRDLLANVSHDLKTPLTMIKAYAEMIRDINFDNKEKRDEDLNIIISETDRLNILVNDLLDLSKLEANREVLNIKEFDLCEMIKRIVKNYSIIEDLENYKFDLKIPDKAIVKADENKIYQVLYNLINNAINYTGKDLRVTIEVIEKKKTYLVNIIDSGKGIKEKELSIIWDKYYKNEKNHKRNKIGSGIGLSIVKNILEKHHFVYGVNSKLNKGTTFYFEITKIS